MATHHFDATVVWSNLGTFVRVASGLRSISVTNDATGLPATVVQNGVTQAGFLIADASGRVTFTTTDIPSVTLDFGAGGLPIASKEAISAGASSASAASASASAASSSASAASASAATAVAATASKIDKTSQMVNVLDYGATGDGTTDDTVAIQNAINAAATLGRGVFIPAASVKYRVTRQSTNTHILTVPSNVTVQGVGPGSHLWYDVSVNAPASGANALVVVMIGTPSTTAKNVRVTGIKVTGNNSLMLANRFVCGIATRLDDFANPSVDPKLCTDVEVDHCIVVDTILGIGFQPSASYAAPVANASTRAQAGYLGARWSIHDNMIDTTTNKAIELSACTDSVIDSNTCVNVYDGPQAIYYSQRVNITNNRVRYMESGVSVTEGCKHILVRGNHLVGITGSTQGASSLGGITIRREPQADTNPCAEFVRIENNFVDATGTSSQRAFGFHRHVSSLDTSYRDILVRANVFLGKVYFYDWQAPTTSSGTGLDFSDNEVTGDFFTHASFVCNFMKITGNIFRGNAITISTQLAFWTHNRFFIAGTNVPAGSNNNVVELNYIAGTPFTDLGTNTRKRGNFVNGTWVP